MTVVVNTHNEQEEKVLLAFLESLSYDYQTDHTETPLTDIQAQELLNRDKKFAEGNTSSRAWHDIKQELRAIVDVVTNNHMLSLIK